MTVIEYGGAKIALDDSGFLLNLEDWNETVASALAEREGIGKLTADMLDILHFLRRFYLEHKFFPIIRAVCKNVDQPRECVTEKFLNPVTAWKVAGLPNPGDEVNLFKTWEPLGF